MFDNFPLMRNIKMSQKLIFMKIKDGRHGGHNFYEPHGTRFDLGTPQILELDTITITKM